MELTEDTLRGANVNPHSYLATDYLNVFNEAMMLLELVADDPEMLEDLIDWSAPEYVEHFVNTNFKGKEVVAAAFEAANPEVRDSFTSRAKTLESLITTEVKVLNNTIMSGEMIIAEDLSDAIELMQRYAAKLDQMIHKGADNAAQDAVDALFD